MLKTIETLLGHWVTFIKAHEKLLIVATLAVLSVHFYGRGLDFLIKHDQTQAQIAQQAAAVSATKFTQDDTANKLVLAQLATLQAQIVQQNQRIDQAMRDRATQTANQKHIDDTSSSAELAARIHTLLGVGEIKVETQNANLPDQLVYSLDAAHADVNNLEDLQQARGDVKDLNTKLEGCTAVKSQQESTIAGLNNQIADGKVALTKEQGSHADDVKLLKTEKKKAWLNGFKWGAITGFLGSLFAHKP